MLHLFLKQGKIFAIFIDREGVKEVYKGQRESLAYTKQKPTLSKLYYSNFFALARLHILASSFILAMIMVPVDEKCSSTLALLW
jgi:hypothetical protein